MTQDSVGIVKHLLDVHGTIGAPPNIITCMKERKKQKKKKKGQLAVCSFQTHFFKWGNPFKDLLHKNPHVFKCHFCDHGLFIS